MRVNKPPSRVRRSVDLRKSIGRRSVEKAVEGITYHNDSVSSEHLSLNFSTNSNVGSASGMEDPDWYKHLGNDNSYALAHVDIKTVNVSYEPEPILPTDPDSSQFAKPLKDCEVPMYLQSSVIIDPLSLRKLRNRKEKSVAVLNDKVNKSSFIDAQGSHNHSDENTSLEDVLPKKTKNLFCKRKLMNKRSSDYEVFDAALNDSSQVSLHEPETVPQINPTVKHRGAAEGSHNRSDEDTSLDDLLPKKTRNMIRRRTLMKKQCSDHGDFEAALNDSSQVSLHEVETIPQINLTVKHSGAAEGSHNRSDEDTSLEDLLPKKTRNLIRKRTLINKQRSAHEVFDAALNDSNQGSLNKPETVPQINPCVEDNGQTAGGVEKPTTSESSSCHNHSEEDTSLDNVLPKKSRLLFHRRGLTTMQKSDHEVFDAALNDSNQVSLHEPDSIAQINPTVEDSGQTEHLVEKPATNEAMNSHNRSEEDTSLEDVLPMRSRNVFHKSILMNQKRSDHEVFDAASNDSSQVSLHEPETIPQTNPAVEHSGAAVDSHNRSDEDTSLEDLLPKKTRNLIRKRTLENKQRSAHEVFDAALNDSNQGSLHEPETVPQINVTVEDNGQTAGGVEKSSTSESTICPNHSEEDTSLDNVLPKKSRLLFHKRGLTNKQKSDHEVFDAALNDSNQGSLIEPETVPQINPCVEDNGQTAGGVEKSTTSESSSCHNHSEEDTSLDNVLPKKSRLLFHRRGLTTMQKSDHEVFDAALNDSNQVSLHEPDSIAQINPTVEGSGQTEHLVEKPATNEAMNSHNRSEEDTSLEDVLPMRSRKVFRKSTLMNQNRSDHEVFDAASNDSSQVSLHEPETTPQTNAAVKHNGAAVDSHNHSDEDTSLEDLLPKKTRNLIRERTLINKQKSDHEVFDAALNDSNQASRHEPDSVPQINSTVEDNGQTAGGVEKSATSESTSCHNHSEEDTSLDNVLPKKSRLLFHKRELANKQKSDHEVFDAALNDSNPVPAPAFVPHISSAVGDNGQEDIVVVKSFVSETVDSHGCSGEETSPEGILFDKKGKHFGKRKLIEMKSSGHGNLADVLNDPNRLPLSESFTEKSSTAIADHNVCREDISCEHSVSTSEQSILHPKKKQRSLVSDYFPSMNDVSTSHSSDKSSVHPPSEANCHKSESQFQEREANEKIPSEGNHDHSHFEGDDDESISSAVSWISNNEENEVSLPSVDPKHHGSKSKKECLQERAPLKFLENRTSKKMSEDKMEKMTNIVMSALAASKEKINEKYSAEFDPLRQSSVMASIKTKPAKKTKETVKKIDPYFKDYHPPRRVRPRPYVNDRMYKFLERQLCPQYGLESRLKAEEFVTFLCKNVDSVIRRNTKYHTLVDEIRNKMVELKLIKCQMDYHIFIENYLPSEFRVKSIPCYGCNLGPPCMSQSELFEPLW